MIKVLDMEFDCMEDVVEWAHNTHKIYLIDDIIEWNPQLTREACQELEDIVAHEEGHGTAS